MARFQVSERKGGTDVSVSTTTSSHRTLPPKSKSPSVIAECQVQSNETTSTGKSSTCESDILMRKSSRTLVQESISNGKDCGPYWNERCAELSSHLWLPTETVLARFGSQIIEFVIQQSGGELVVLNEVSLSPEQELKTDLLTILHVFSCRLHGLRKYKSQIQEDQDIS